MTRCHKCGDELVPGNNWWDSSQRSHYNLCNRCRSLGIGVLSPATILLKVEAFTRYSVTGRLECECGEGDLEVLTIGHPEGDGAAKRAAGEPSGWHLLGWLRKNGWPPGYLTQCHNCQARARHVGWQDRRAKYLSTLAPVTV